MIDGTFLILGFGLLGIAVAGLWVLLTALEKIVDIGKKFKTGLMVIVAGVALALMLIFFIQ